MRSVEIREKWGSSCGIRLLRNKTRTAKGAPKSYAILQLQPPETQAKNW